MNNLSIGLQLTAQNLRMRFEKSKLGITWFFIEPLISIGIFYVVFSQIMSARISHYVFYLCLGIIPWAFIGQTLQDVSGALFVKKNLIMNTALDKRIIPLSYCLAHGVSFLISLTILLGIMVAAEKVSITMSSLWLLFIVCMQFIFCYGLSLIVAILSVLVRDILYGMHLLLLLWFYATPIFYTKDMVPAHFHWIIDYNPMTLFIHMYRIVILEHTNPSLQQCGLLVLYAAGVFLLGDLIFQTFKRHIIKAL